MVREFGPYDRKVVLQNGMEFYGYSFGSKADGISEIVFNTSVVGYQEIVTDPSYTDKMVIMTYPLIGNYGMTDEDNESRQSTIGGLIVREYNDSPSNFRYTKTLSEVLEENGIPGISGVDTRAISSVIRDEGSMTAIITSAETEKEAALIKLRSYQVPTDAVKRVSCKKRWYSRTANPWATVVAIDLGIKHGIIRMLNVRGVNVTVMPENATAKEIMKVRPDGVIVSNGPGNPEDAKSAIQTVTDLIGKTPVLGIGLGCQIIALACQAKIEKLKVGHHGNPPVRNLQSGKIEMTSQGHSYQIVRESMEGTMLRVTHENVLDGSVEGIASEENFVYGVQFHPESAPGPEDSTALFDEYLQRISDWRDMHA